MKIKNQLFGFIVAGLISTLMMLGLYAALYKLVNYQLAYFMAYAVSVTALYFMNTYVFNSSISLKNFLGFPLIYLFQYLVGAASLEILVWHGFLITFAPLLVIILMLPVTFLLNRLVFSKP